MREIGMKQIKQAIRTKFAWPGGYEIFFITSDGALLCMECSKENFHSIVYSVKNNLSDGWNVNGITLDNEMEELEYCSHCNKEINFYEG